MTEATLDARLPLPPPPASIPRLGLLPDGLARSSLNRDAGYVVEGARVAVTGRQSGSVGRVHIDGHLVASDVTANLGRVVNLAVSPGRLRREWVGAVGTALEVVLAAASLPLVAIQWAIPSGGPESVSITLLPGAGLLRYHAGHDSVVATGNALPDRLVAIAVSPPTANWSTTTASDGGLRVEARPDADGPVTLLITSGTRAEIDGALQAAARLDAQERVAIGRDTAEGLRLTSGVPDLDDGLSWARTRLAASLSSAARARGPEAPDANGTLWSGIGALSVGDEAAARQALLALEGDAAWPHGAILAGKLAQLTGDPGPAFPFADTAWEARRSTEAGPEHPSLTSLALRALADGLTHSAPEHLIAKLREVAADPGGRGPARRLPTIQRPSMPPVLGAWLESALAGVGRAPVPVATGLDRWISAWGQSASDPDGAWAAWLAGLSSGLREGPSGPGTWDFWRPHGTAPETGVMLATLVHGFLGLAPDAPAGRIRIGPRLPRHVTNLHVGGMRVADAEVTLSYERIRSLHTFALTPLRGRVPPVAIFQPELWGRVTAVKVDGSTADLTASVQGPRSGVSLQIPIDSTRTVEIETD